MLSFLASELGDDNGGAWPWDARVPESELSVGSVHLANFASQTFVVTYEYVALVSQLIHKRAEDSPRACCFFY